MGIRILSFARLERGRYQSVANRGYKHQYIIKKSLVRWVLFVDGQIQGSYGNKKDAVAAANDIEQQDL